MSWNYRILRRRYVGWENNTGPTHEDMYGIYEVYYDEEGKPTKCSENPAYLEFDHIESLFDTMCKIQRVFEKPILEYDTLEKYTNV